MVHLADAALTDTVEEEEEGNMAVLPPEQSNLLSLNTFKTITSAVLVISLTDDEVTSILGGYSLAVKQHFYKSSTEKHQCSFLTFDA